MKDNKGLTLVALVITIIALLILSGVSLYLVFGKNGVLTKATTVEETFNKSEVLEEINVIITEKYLDAYSKATKDGKNNIEQYYDGEKVMMFLKGYSGGETGSDFSGEPDKKVIIQDLYGVDNETATEKCYFIIIDSLNRSITKYGLGTNSENSKDYFYIKGAGESYKVFYKNLDGKDEEVGDVQIQQNL